MGNKEAWLVELVSRRFSMGRRGRRDRNLEFTSENGKWQLMLEQLFI